MKTDVRVIFPDDVLLEIFIWLPLLSVLRFKSVCKLWNIIFSDPYFVTIHTRHVCNQQVASGVIFTYTNNSSYYYSFKKGVITLPDPSASIIKKHAGSTFNTKDLKLSAICSLDGLILYRAEALHDNKCFLMLFYLYNPFTLDFKEIPQPDKEFSKSNIEKRMSLIPGYRVISLKHAKVGKDKHKYLVKIYSWETCKWNNCGDGFTRDYKLLAGKGEFWNGSVNWYSSRGDGYRCIVSFDIENYTVREIPLPMYSSVHSMGLPSGLYSTGVSGGELCITMGFLFVFDIMVAAKDYSGWSVLHHIDLRSDPILKRYEEELSFWSSTWNFWAFTVLKGSKKEDDKLLMCFEKKEFICNLLNQTVYELGRLEGLNEHLERSSMLPFTPTLVSPNLILSSI
ncbi:putative F-box domain-containing protein [Dioscorea sansibarensis]